MGLEIKEGKLRVNASYSLKVPLEAQYASQSAGFAISLEMDADGDSTAILAQGENIESQLAAAVKLATFAQLGVDFKEDGNGMLQPVVLPKAAPSGGGGGSAPSQPQQRQGSGGNGSGQYGQPKADVTKQPIVTFHHREGLHAFYDLRSLKADGTYKQGAADFRSVSEGTKRQVWIRSKDGVVNDEIAGALQQAGIDF